MDLIITSASRPQSLQSEIDAFFEHIKYSGGWSLRLHEDVVPGMEKESAELVDWAVGSGWFETIYVSNPRIGRGPALNKMKHLVRGKYCFYMEEDFDFVRFVNLDNIIKVMDNHPHINQVAFNWRHNKSTPKPGGPNGQDHYIYEDRKFDGQTMHVTERWTWQPAIWRLSWVMPRWNFAQQRSNKMFNRKLKEGIGHEEWNPKWHEKNIGAYYYGSVKEKAYVKHTSWDIRHDREFL